MDDVKIRFLIACVVGHGYADAAAGDVVALPPASANYFLSRGFATPVAEDTPAAAPVNRTDSRPRSRKG